MWRVGWQRPQQSGGGVKSRYLHCGMMKDRCSANQHGQAHARLGRTGSIEAASLQATLQHLPLCFPVGTLGVAMGSCPNRPPPTTTKHFTGPTQKSMDTNKANGTLAMAQESSEAASPQISKGCRCLHATGGLSFSSLFFFLRTCVSLVCRKSTNR